jgi:hypothetical protein
MSRREIQEILQKSKVIAVIGLSRDPKKASHRVSLYMKEHGFTIIPVNPTADKILGEKSYKTLVDIPSEIQKTVDIIDVFRPAENVPSIVAQAIKLRETHGKPDVIWMQLGIVNEDAAKAAEEAGLSVIVDKCIMIEHKHLG